MKPGPVARLSKPATRKDFLRAVENGMPLELASQMCGFDFETFRRYRKAHPEFGEEVERARIRAANEDLKVVIKCRKSKDEAIRLRAATWRLTHVRPVCYHFAEHNTMNIQGSIEQTKTIILAWPHQQPPPESEAVPITNGHSNGHPARTASESD